MLKGRFSLLFWVPVGRPVSCRVRSETTSVSSLFIFLCTALIMSHSVLSSSLWSWEENSVFYNVMRSCYYYTRQYFMQFSSCTVPARLSHQPLKLQVEAGETGCQILGPHSPALYPSVEPELSYWGGRFQLCKASTDHLKMGLNSVFKMFLMKDIKLHSNCP